jgi:F0F1-type ATP synthase membrane subunit b/b'
VRAEAAAARERLDRDADTLATTIVERVLGRSIS